MVTVALLLQDPRRNKGSVISGGFAVLVPRTAAQSVDEFRRTIAAVAEDAREPVNPEEISLRTLRLGDPVGVKQKRVASFKLHGSFLKSF